MKTAELKVETRNPGNRSLNRGLRVRGFVPANLYGPKKENRFCSFDERDLARAFKDSNPGNTILVLKSDDSSLNETRVIVKEIARDPANWRPVHADLYQIDLTRPLTVQVPIDFKGTPEGVKIGGGLLQIVRRQIELRALPDRIPEKIEVDISDLKLNQSIHISDIQAGEGVEFLDSGAFTLASVIEQKEEEEVRPVAAAADAAPAGEGTATPAATAAAEDKEKKDA